jgi:hypothetical protein
VIWKWVSGLRVLAGMGALQALRSYSIPDSEFAFRKGFILNAKI